MDTSASNEPSASADQGDTTRGNVGSISTDMEISDPMKWAIYLTVAGIGLYAILNLEVL
jgi:hypothetical protein